MTHGVAPAFGLGVRQALSSVGPRGDAGGVEAELGEDGVGLAVGDVRDRGAEHARPAGGVACGSCREMASAISEPTPPSRMPSSTVTTSGCCGGVGDHLAGRAGTTRTSHTVASMPSAASASAASLAAASILPTARMQTSRPVADLAGRPGRSRPRPGATCGAAVFDQRMAAGPVAELEGVVEHHAELLVRRRREHGHARHLGEQHHVEHAVVRRPVVAGDAGAVEAEHHRLAVQADVVGDLVDGPGEERGVDGDDRAQPAHGHAGGGGDGVLLGDADVDAAGRGSARRTGSRPVESGMAAVMATSSGRASASLIIASVNAAV